MDHAAGAATGGAKPGGVLVRQSTPECARVLRTVPLEDGLAGAARLLSAFHRCQINAQVPYTVSGKGATHLEVFYQAKSAGTLDLTVTANVPAVFSTIVQQDGTYN